MRAALRFLLPLLGFLALLAWGAAALVNATTRRWFEDDVARRAELALAGARETLVSHWRAGERRKVARLLEEIAGDERIMAAAACGPDGGLFASTPGHNAEEHPCAAVASRALAEPGAGPSRWHGSGSLAGGRVLLSAEPVLEGDRALGFVLLVHDLSFIDRREASTRRFTLLAFGIVGAAAALVTLLAARFSRTSFASELRRLARGGRDASGSRAFAPALADVRELLGDLAAERSSATAGGWPPERLRQTLTRHLGGEGVVIVANREPYIHDRAADGAVRVLYPASGLVTALEPVMRACSGTWIAHGSGSADASVVDRHDRVRVPPGEESYVLRRVWLTPEQERGYYYGFANEGLWPLCHVVHVRPTFRAEDWAHYQRVNALFADAVVEETGQPDPIVLVQDYHFALLPRLIRERLPRATVITFWHIPWPNAERFGICPWPREILEGMLGSSILGFHTQLHCNNFTEAVDRHLEARIDREKNAIVLGGRETLVRPYPISIDWPSRWARGAPPPQVCREEVFAELRLPRGALLGLGVDRLDYTKGIEDRLLAVERLLERFPHYRGRFVFAQLAAPSRTAIERYRQLNESVEETAARVNARFAADGYRPVVMLREHHEPARIFRYYRAARLCYVSSLHDGMNLVAKEFVAARDDEQGVLVLSRFTGAARELTEALLVNPYDLEEASSALAAALEMPAEEQRERMRAMRVFLGHFNVYRWAGRMLADAAILRDRDRRSGRLPERPTPVRAAP